MESITSLPSIRNGFDVGGDTSTALDNFNEFSIISSTMSAKKRSKKEIADIENVQIITDKPLVAASPLISHSYHEPDNIVIPERNYLKELFLNRNNLIHHAPELKSILLIPKHFSGFKNQLHASTVYVGEVLNPITRKILKLKSELEILKPIMAGNAFNFINDEPELIEPLLDYLREIQNYFQKKGEPYNLNIILQEDPLEKEFKVLIISIQVNFEDIDLEIEMIEDIGKLLDKLDEKCVFIKGNDFYNKLSAITYIVEETD